jgi:hypothetical protein
MPEYRQLRAPAKAVKRTCGDYPDVQVGTLRDLLFPSSTAFASCFRCLFHPSMVPDLMRL